MLKLPKGLKKKKKLKKKDKELFTEEELEQFKKDQEAKKLAEQQDQSQIKEQGQQTKQPTASTSKPNTDEDEWSKFTQLTSGIDSILKKTQGDLNRIKEKSFFQKVESPKPKPAVKLEKEKAEEVEKEQKPTLTVEELEEQRRLEALRAAVVELSESENESEDGDDIFDTNYIDELASGNLPLAYIPDSPDENTDLGPDPFDTNFAEKVIKGPEVSKRGKKIVNIGSAVEVLTGRVENIGINKEALKRPRRGPQNLLLSSFDQDKDPTEEEITFEEIKSVVTEEKPLLSLLDDSSDVIVDAPIDLGHLDTRYLEFLKKKQEEEKEIERLRKEAERDEFDDLATESLTKPKSDVIVIDPSTLIIESIPIEPSNWKSEFEQQAELGIVDIYDDDIEEIDVDPFDTEFVATVVREKSIDDDDDDFDPRAGEEPVEPESIAKIQPQFQSTLTVKQKDLLSGSTSDLTDSSLSHIPVISASKSIEKEIDPFDTSNISALVQPKETEIKYLEQELLSDSGLKHSISDPDFDPRSDEKVIQSQLQQTKVSTAERKSSLSLNISNQLSKTVGFDVSGSGANSVNSEGKKKPLTPYYTDKSIEEIVTETFGGDISDSDFDPRAVTPNENQTQKPDLLSVNEKNIDIKVLTPATTTSQDEEITVEDPFDTSNASALLVPGKAELKLIENEFIETVKITGAATNVLDINSDSQELGLGGKVLTPQITLPTEDSFDDIDPFDTSFASNTAPGQAEIKIIESELIHK